MKFSLMKFSLMKFSLWILTLLLLLSAGCAPTTGDLRRALTGFEITNIAGPRQIVYDTGLQPFSVVWAGDPTFPVTISIRHTNCGTPECNDATVEVMQVTNPVNFSYECFTRDNRLDDLTNIVSIQLIDANGAITDPVDVPITCSN